MSRLVRSHRLRNLRHRSNDALLRISAPFDRQKLADIEPLRKKKAEEGRRIIRDIMQQRSLRENLHGHFASFPQKSSAKESGMSLDEYPGLCMVRAFSMKVTL